MSGDPRLAAFLSPTAPEVFRSVAHQHEIWNEDPFDIEQIHVEARTLFERLLVRSADPSSLASGRILLVRGDSGCGKTHLMRAFRASVHGRGRGYLAYLQMTTSTSAYDRYILANVIDSLDKPYWRTQSEESGLLRLSNALAESDAVPRKLCAAMRDGGLEGAELAELVDRVADGVVEVARFAPLGTDLDLLRAILYLQPNDPRLKVRVLKYLRCEALSTGDRSLLGGIPPRHADDDPQKVVAWLGALMRATDGSALVVCIDQLEDTFDEVAAHAKFRRAMSAVCGLASMIPSAIFVISCLDDYYVKLSGTLTASMRDRIEHDPEPVRLEALLEPHEVELLVAARVRYLFETSGAPFDEEDPTYPFPRETLRALGRKRTRDVLDWCRSLRDTSIRTGKPPAFGDAGARGAPEPRPAPAGAIELEQVWNDFRTAYGVAPPDDDDALASLLAWAIGACPAEIEGLPCLTVDTQRSYVDVSMPTKGPGGARLLVGICNRSARGGALGRQIEELEKRADCAVPVVVRSTAFPDRPRTQIAEQIGRLIERGGRRVVVEDSDWRTFLALREFRKHHEPRPDLASWLRSERPLTRLPSVRELLALDRLPPQAATAAHAPAPATEESPPPAPTPSRAPSAIDKPSRPADPVTAPLSEEPWIGSIDGIVPKPLLIDRNELTRHAAFLGGSGSGKTTLALNIVEQLLVRKIPAILLDRKGDLCRYADPEAWRDPLPDPALASLRERLRDHIDVALFTPGHADGRPLGIAVVPARLADLPAHERDPVTRSTAGALAGMLGYKDGPRDRSCLALLATTLGYLAGLDLEREITLATIMEALDRREPDLLARVGRLDEKLFRKLVQDLQTLELTSGDLLSTRGERVDADALLGRNGRGLPGKTRLSVISTKFLGSNAATMFWVAQLLIELGRWTSRHPCSALQAVLMLDEADLYLPAQQKPATKEPVEHLLRRARSAGLGVFLATQSPGDLDYRCRENVRSWFTGRVKEETALRKLRPMFGEAGVDAESRLPGQLPGHFHLLREGQATSFAARRSLIAPKQLGDDAILELARRTARAETMVTASARV